MALEIRKGRDGKIINHWYGRFTDHTGKRRVIALTEPIPAKGVPDSLRDSGSPAFEASRARAEKEIEAIRKEAAERGRADHITERVIESRTGRKAEYNKISDLQTLWRNADREDGQPSETHLRWCDSVFLRFAESVNHIYLYEVTPDNAKAFLDKCREDLAPDTVRRIRALLRSAFSMFLPVGTDNPLKKKIKSRKKATNGRTGRRPLTPDEIARLLETAEKTDRLLYELSVTAISTGLRIGDVCQLKWSKIDLSQGWIDLNVSKTGNPALIPIWPKLQEVLEARLPEHAQKQPFVFPEAERMYNGISEKGWDTRKKIYYRGKKLFALAFCDTAPKDRTTKNRIELSEVLPEAIEAVNKATMKEQKRERIITVLELYADGKTYTEIAENTGLSKGQISDYLKDAENLSGWIFRIASRRRQDLKTLMSQTRQKPKQGKLAVSVLGWHNLKTTFITIALANGVPRETIKKITGNSDFKTVIDHYYKPNRDHIKAAMTKLPDIITGNTKSLQPPTESKPDVSALAAQLAQLTESEKAELKKVLA